jgi:hypothetical protein
MEKLKLGDRVEWRYRGKTYKATICITDRNANKRIDLCYCLSFDEPNTLACWEPRNLTSDNWIVAEGMIEGVKDNYLWVKKNTVTKISGISDAEQQILKEIYGA